MQNIIQEWNGRVYETRVVIQPGEHVEVPFATSGHATLKIRALGAGVSAFVEDCTSPSTMLADGTAEFDPIETIGVAGVITNKCLREEILTPITALRITATGGPVTVEVLQ